MHQLKGRRMHRVAAKIAKEVVVLLEHRDGDARTRQQITQHHSSGPTADNATGGFDGFSRHTFWIPLLLRVFHDPADIFSGGGHFTLRMAAPKSAKAPVTAYEATMRFLETAR